MTAEELLPIFRVWFSEFDTKSDADILKLLNEAILIHAICEMATIYLAAHLCVLDDKTKVGSTGGEVDGGGIRETASETAKSINTSFKTVAADGSNDAFYSNSPYGRKYITFRNACPGAKFSVRVA